MFAALIPALTGPLAKVIGFSLAIAGVVLFVLWALAQHDGKLEAQRDLLQAQHSLAQLHAQALQNEKALTDNLLATQARAAALQHTRERIASAPITTACSGSPAIRSALDGLLPPSSGALAAPADPRSPPAVQGGAIKAPR